MDWNWFFSSFCQSAAALIGIIGAFVISRLLGISEKISGVISELDNLIIEFNEIILKVNSRHFYWFTKTHVKNNSDLQEQIKNGEFENLTEKEILEKIYNLDDRLYRIDEAILESFNEVYKKHKPEYIDYGNGLLTKTNYPIIDFPPKNLWSDLENEKELIDQLQISSHILIQKFNKNYQDLISFDNSIKSLRNVIVLILVAFPLTVIYPLHFMPMFPNKNPEITINLKEILSSLLTIKNGLLFVFFITIEGLFYYFLSLIKNLNVELKSAKEYNSKDIKNIKRYSIYFK